MHQLNTDCAGVVMPDRKVGLSANPLPLASPRFLHLFGHHRVCRICGVQGLGLSSSEVAGRMACCFGSPCPLWSRLLGDLAAEIPCSAQGLSAGWPAENPLGDVHSSAQRAWPLLCPEKYKQTRSPLGTAALEAFLSLDRLETPRAPYLQGRHLAARLS